MDTWHVRNRYIQNVGGQIRWKEITSRICRIIFKCVVKNVVEIYAGLIRFVTGARNGVCEQDNEPSGSITWEDVLASWHCEVLKRDVVPWR